MKRKGKGKGLFGWLKKEGKEKPQTGDDEFMDVKDNDNVKEGVDVDLDQGGLNKARAHFPEENAEEKAEAKEKENAQKAANVATGKPEEKAGMVEGKEEYVVNIGGQFKQDGANSLQKGWTDLMKEQKKKREGEQAKDNPEDNTEVTKGPKGPNV